jgi:hypothetical protein
VQSAADVLVVLQENQQLLNLPPEQARSLTGVLEAAATQADQIAAAWNPATTPAGTRTEIQDLRVQINLAAVRQANGKAAPRMVEPKHILGRQFCGVTGKNPSHLMPRSMGPGPDTGR